MADVWRPELAKRFYGYVAAGGSAGAILGPTLVTALVHEIGPTPLIVMACAFILCSALLRDRTRARVAAPLRDGRACRTRPFRWAAARWTTSRAWRATPYLLGIAGHHRSPGRSSARSCTTSRAKYVAATYTSLADRAALFADMEFCVNLLSLFFQAVRRRLAHAPRQRGVEPVGDAGADRRAASWRSALFPIGERAARDAGASAARRTTASASRRARCCSRC